MEGAELAARVAHLSLSNVGGDNSGNPSASTPSPAAGRRRLDSFAIVCLIGKGGFGKVFLVRHRATGDVYALKVMEKATLVERRAVRDAHAERNILAMVGARSDAPFIVRLHAAFQTSKRVYLVMDFASGGELMYHLRQEAMLSECAARFYAAELLVALEALHRLDVVHRDIKPENVLLDGDGHLVLTDFGLAKDLAGLPGQKHSWCGSEDYMAPETLAREPHTGKPADYWAFGVFLFDCLVGEPPFSPLRERGRTSRKKLHERILKCKYKLPTWLSRECHSLLRALLTRDPEKRLTDPDAIRAHPWFKGIDWDSVRSRELDPPIVPNVGGSGTGCFSPSLTEANLSINSPAPSPIAIPGRRVSARGATPSSSPGMHPTNSCASPAMLDEDAVWGGFSFVAPGMEAHFALPSGANGPAGSPRFEAPSPAMTPSLQTHTLAAERAEFSVDAAEAVEIVEDGVDLASRAAAAEEASSSPTAESSSAIAAKLGSAPGVSFVTPAPMQVPSVEASSSIAAQLGSAPGVSFVAPGPMRLTSAAATVSPFTRVAASIPNASSGTPLDAGSFVGADGVPLTGTKQQRRRQRKKMQKMQQAAQKAPQASLIKPPHQLKIPPSSGAPQ